MTTAEQSGRWRRVLGGAICVLVPSMVACLVGAIGLGIGRIMPWEPFALDLGIYRRAGVEVLRGEDFYQPHLDSWPFIYPPFAALLAVPLAWLSWSAVTVIFPVINAGLLMLIGHRFGLRGWRLSALTTAVILIVEPVRMTLAFGQINIILMALILFDSLPGKRFLPGRRMLPEGWLTGVATGIKLTPGIFAVHQLLARRWRVASTIVITFLASMIIGWLVFPQASRQFWSRLLGGDSGINEGLVHYTNQSVMGNAVRLFGESSSTQALLVAALAGLVGVAAGAAWQRLGQVGLGLCLTGFAALVASPISWSHHYVWVVPLGLALYQGRDLPKTLRISGWLLVGYVSLAPFNLLPYQEQQTWPLWIRLLDGIGLLLALLFLIIALTLGVRQWRTQRASANPPRDG